MSKEAIIEKITSSAKLQAAEILAAASCRGEKIIEAAEIQAAEICHAVDQNFATQKADAVAQRVASAELEVRNLLLEKKLDGVEKVFALAEDKLMSMEAGEYKKLVTKIIQDNASAGDKIIISQTDKKILTEDFFDQLNKKAKVQVIFDGEYSSAFKKGIIISNKNMDKNFTFEAMMASVRRELAAKAAELLENVR